MKARIGGWILFGFGIFLAIGAIIYIPGMILYGADVKIGLEFASFAVPAGFCIWGGWKLAHSVTGVAREELRSQYLAYYGELAKLMAFQTKEADIYNNALVVYRNSLLTSDKAAREMCRAARRLVESAKAIVIYINRMPTLPDVIAMTHFLWQKTFLDYQAWTEAQAAAFEAIAAGMEPAEERVRELFLQAEKSEREATKAEERLVRRLGVKPSDLKQSFNNALVAVEKENWQPKDIRTS
jgi:hypothetical protein